MLIGRNRRPFDNFRSTKGKSLSKDWPTSRLATAGKRKCPKKVLKQWRLVLRIKVDDEFIAEFVKEISENENTKKSTEY